VKNKNKFLIKGWNWKEKQLLLKVKKRMRITLIKIIYHEFELNNKIKKKLDFYKMIKINKNK